MYRTQYCGLLTEAEVGRTERVCGWAQNKRDMGGVIFIDLRDREGELQLVFDASIADADSFAAADGLRVESVITVTGRIRIRGPETYNPKLRTGTIELAVASMTVLSRSQPLPFSLEEKGVREDLRLKYRYLDLRRPEMLANLRFRAKVQRAACDYLDTHGFIPVETPMLGRSTPEGAREYLVPSRVNPGRFYALPQSPQIYKQLLMVGGIDRYYQVAHCFRDEDLRADRQPEFTQIDMEMSFVDQEDILVHLEAMFKYLFRETIGLELTGPFQRLPWTESEDRYGSDKPDLRFDMPIIELTPIASRCSFSVFRSVCDKGGVVRALCVKGGGDRFTRTDIEELTDRAIALGAKGMAWIALRSGSSGSGVGSGGAAAENAGSAGGINGEADRYSQNPANGTADTEKAADRAGDNGEIYSILTKYLTTEEIQRIISACGAEKGDFILFCADKLTTVRRVLGTLRCEIADRLGLRSDGYKILFITDFPQFEYSEDEKRWVATHHPFTMPYPEDLKYLKTDPGRVRAQAYDVVLNGIELGSGSVRIHDSEVQKVMFEALGFTPDQIRERFGFMVDAFSYGTPPHGGFAFGLDRLVMQLIGAPSLREVIAFPMNKDGVCPMTDAPGKVDPKQLEILHLAALGAQDEEKTAAHSAPKVDIDVLANLAKLSLTEKEKAQAEEDLRSIIAFAGELMKVDTSDVPEDAYSAPAMSGGSSFNVFREDEVKTEFTRGQLLADAPTRSEDGAFITVPRVVG